MSHEAAERHAPIAATLPKFPHPLRVDQKPRLCPTLYDKHGQWPLGLTLEPTARDRLPWAVDGYLDGKARRS
jgi:hypothetical protein